MPRRQRILFAGANYHVFNRGVEKRPIFFDDSDRRFFLKMLKETKSRLELEIYAYCLMPNHFHLFLKTENANLDKAMHYFFSKYVQYINLKHDRVGPLFQGRYRCRIVDKDAYSLAVVRYIHKNPTDLDVPMDAYPWSSYSGYLRNEGTASWLNTSWILDQFHSQREKAKKLFENFHLNEVPGYPGTHEMAIK